MALQIMSKSKFLSCAKADPPQFGMCSYAAHSRFSIYLNMHSVIFGW
jgi:hypothetical protein